MRSKKLVIGYAVAIFLLVFIITFNSVCSITQFDVRYETGSTAASASAEKVQARLNEYLNKSYLFFKTGNVDSIVEQVCAEDGTYLNVISVKKSFPNKVSVVIEEEYERYAYSFVGKDAEGNDAEFFYVTDENGKILSIKKSNESNIHGAAANVKIKGFTFSSAAVGETLAADQRVQFSLLNDMLAYADDALGGIAGRFSEIEYNSGGRNGLEYFHFVFTEGLELWLMAHEDNPLENDGSFEADPLIAMECFKEAISCYLGLSDAQKTYGYLRPGYVTKDSEGNPIEPYVNVEHFSGTYSPPSA